MKDNIVSELELTETGGRDQNENTNNSVGKEENGVKEKQNKRTFLERVKNVFKFITLEPFLLCYIIPPAIINVAQEKFNWEKACRIDLNFTEGICALVLNRNIADDDNITIAALNDVQKKIADMSAWQTPLQNGISAIAIIFVGAWSDRTGNRKFLMLVPIMGELVCLVGLLLATYFFLEWPLWVTALIEALPSGFSGGFSVVLMGSFSYIADVTTVESRTFRIGVLVVIVMLGTPLGSSISGVLAENVGYYGVFGIGAVIYVLGFLYTYFVIHDVKRNPMKGTFGEKLKNFFHPKYAWETISLLFMSRGTQFIQIILVICAHTFIIGPVSGEGKVKYLYTTKKYNMTDVEFGLFNSYTTLLGVAGTAITLLLFSKLLKMHDALIGAIATTSKVMSSLVYSLAPTKTWFYVAPMADFFGNSGGSIIKSLGTKVVDKDKVGKMCSLIGLVEAIVPAIYSPLYSMVYKYTLSGAHYLLGAFMTVPSFFIFMYLYVIQRRQERDRVQNPEEKERHAHENHATVL